MEMKKSITAILVILIFASGKINSKKVDVKLMREDFEYSDSDKNGFLDAQEIREVIPSLMEDDLAEFMEVADSDRDGVLTFEEFMHAYDDLLKKAGNGDNKEEEKKDNTQKDVDDLPDDY